MRPTLRALFALAATFALAGPVLAEVTEGKITEIDRDKLTITLDDGTVYRVNSEFNMDSLKTGEEVYLSYDEVNGENVVTDLDQGD